MHSKKMKKSLSASADGFLSLSVSYLNTSFASKFHLTSRKGFAVSWLFNDVSYNKILFKKNWIFVSEHSANEAVKRMERRTNEL